MSFPTKSEIMFEEFCTAHCIPFTRIVCGDGKTPDYDIQLGGRIVVAELKEFSDNDDDKETLDEYRATGSACQWPESDERVRRKIKKANGQIKARTQGQSPGMLVLYDNRTFEDVDRDDIKSAMYGDETVTITPISYTHEIVSAIHPGDNGVCRRKSNTSISAVATMWRCGMDTCLSIYHNHFAARPIDPEWFHAPLFRHFACDPTDRHWEYEWRAVEFAHKSG